jgi:hypothetical protein
MPKESLMGFLEKIETFINALLIRLGWLIWKIIPRPIKVLITFIQELHQRLSFLLKRIPHDSLRFGKYFFKKLIQMLLWAKSKTISGKEKSIEILKTISVPGSNKFKTFLLLPWFIITRWLKDLSASQTIMLLCFTAGSTLAIISIGFSGQRMLKHISNSRVPASIEEITYDRPEYYKKHTRHVQISNLRLPVYVAKVNEIKSVDIDFVATMSNRQTRIFLEKHDFQLRDHLVLQVEPSVATFPLVAEGKEIIKLKLIEEINLFLKNNKVDGEVTEIKITFVLAN